MKRFCLFFFICLVNISNAQSITKKVLFIGSSFTQYNTLPNLVASCASSTNDFLIIDSSLDSNSTFSNLVNNQAALTKINSNQWDYVVLQEHFRRPALSIDYVNNSVFPFATQLSNLIRENYNCSTPIFFNTWGCQNGDSQVCLDGNCTYEVMDDLLQERYQIMADNNKGLISPVGQVWRYLRENHPDINLYSADQINSSIQGSMAAAYTFYTIIFRKNPNLVTFRYQLDIPTANIIRNAVKVVVYDHLDDFYVDSHDNFADFDIENINSNEIQFENTTEGATNFLWSFGDVTTSNLQNPIHLFTTPGTYNVNLTLTVCGKTYSKTKSIVIETLSNELFQVENLNIYPNPSSNFLYISISDFDSIEIFDMLGKKISPKFQSIEDQTKIDIEHLAKGSYVLRVLKANQYQSFKFVKE